MYILIQSLCHLDTSLARAQHCLLLVRTIALSSILVPPAWITGALSILDGRACGILSRPSVTFEGATSKLTCRDCDLIQPQVYVTPPEISHVLVPCLLNIHHHPTEDIYRIWCVWRVKGVSTGTHVMTRLAAWGVGAMEYHCTVDVFHGMRPYPSNRGSLLLYRWNAAY